MGVLEYDSQNKLMQFIIRLNMVYDSVRNHILSMDPFPSVNQVYYLVQQIEKQKQSNANFFRNFEMSTFFLKAATSSKNYTDKKKFKGNVSCGFCIHCMSEGHAIKKLFPNHEISRMVQREKIWKE